MNELYSSSACGEAEDEADEKSQQRGGRVRRGDRRHVQRIRSVFNRLKCSGIRWLHVKLFSVIQL